MAIGRRTRWALGITGGLIAVAGLALGGYVVRNLGYAEWDAAKVTDAGFVEKQVTVNGSRMNYAEGPDNGPPLLLIPGQVMDWETYNRVLPDLSESFHVFAIDVYGHGKSERVPEKYNAKALAADVRRFLTDVVGEPAVVSGHSSGGLVAAAVAAEAPKQVLGVVLEDPPFFSSVLPRAKKTFNYVDLASTAHDFVRSDEKDFTVYYIEHGAVWDLFQGMKDAVQKNALSYRRDHPGQPVKLALMPPSLNEMFRPLDNYDPRFGVTFYDGSFHQGFDHAETLRNITVPAVLIHTNWSYDQDGILLAAMSGEDAKRARSLLEDVRFHKVDTGHNFHFEDPDRFSEIVTDFGAELAGDGERPASEG